MTATGGITIAEGIRYHPGHLDLAAQAALLLDLRAVLRAAPLFTPTMPRTGKPFSVRMTNCGPLGWVSDRQGYRYQPCHPETGAPWPAIPGRALDAWTRMAAYDHPPEACLVNVYVTTARMGMHQDRDEAELAAPIVSLSLGDTAIFRFGAVERGGRTRTLRLASGDALVMGGPARLAYHGVDRVLAGTSRLLGEGGRINLTLRRVTKPSPSPPDSL